MIKVKNKSVRVFNSTFFIKARSNLQSTKTRESYFTNAPSRTFLAFITLNILSLFLTDISDTNLCKI